MSKIDTGGETRDGIPVFKSTVLLLTVRHPLYVEMSQSRMVYVLSGTEGY